MLYSVIVPHYNDPERVDRLLKSVPIDREDLEVLVIDDCSPKQEALGPVKARWPTERWLSTPENSGAGAARNIGIDEASGVRLVFADSDDVFLPDAFDVFDEYVGSDTELAYFMAESVQEVDGSPSVRADGVNRFCQNYLDSSTDGNLERLKLGHVVPWAKVYSRAFVISTGVRFDETWVSNDVAFNVLAAVQATEVSVVPLPVYCVYQRGGSLTMDMTAQSLLMRLEVLGHLNGRLRKLGLQERMHAASYIARAVRFGPITWLRVFGLIVRHGILGVTLRRLSPLEVRRFLRRSRQSSLERKRIPPEN